MIVKQNKETLIVRLERGEELISSLLELANTQGIDGAFFSGLGGAESAELGIYRIDTDKQYHFREFAGPLELISINGNIAKDENGEPMIHCHATISGVDLVVSGGHVKSAIVSGTCELLIDLRSGPLQRKMNEDIGLKLLELEDEQ